MDTSTHFVMGIGLFALSHIDPVIASDPETARVVLLSTVISSEIPDIDTLYRFRGNAIYIRKHRGFSHSIPMIFIWPTLLTALAYLIFPEANWIHVWLWSFVAVFIHVFIDCFNSYGTQILRPFSRKWVAWHIINIFDVFIMSVHLLGFALWWFFPQYPEWIFIGVYLSIIAYIFIRWKIRRNIIEYIQSKIGQTGRYTLVPTVRFHTWHVIVELPDRVLLGEWKKGQLEWANEMTTRYLHHPAVKESKKADAIRSFLSFTSYGYPMVIEHPFGYEVRWIDVRYHDKKSFPFMAVVLLDQQYRIFYSFVGWIGRENLEKRINQWL